MRASWRWSLSAEARLSSGIQAVFIKSRYQRVSAQVSPQTWGIHFLLGLPGFPMDMRIPTLAAAVAISFSAAATTTASAATVVLDVSTVGGLEQTYELASGNFLSLWQIRNTDDVGLGTADITVDNRDQLLAGFTALTTLFPGFPQGTILRLFNGADPVNDGAAEFSAVTFGFTVPQDTVRSFWIEWSGSSLMWFAPPRFEVVVGRATIAGDPVTPIPVPAALPLLLAGLGALGLAARRRKAA
jgi:hypothetical protein